MFLIKGKCSDFDAFYVTLQTKICENRLHLGKNTFSALGLHWFLHRSF